MIHKLLVDFIENDVFLKLDSFYVDLREVVAIKTKDKIEGMDRAVIYLKAFDFHFSMFADVETQEALVQYWQELSGKS